MSSSRDTSREEEKFDVMADCPGPHHEPGRPNGYLDFFEWAEKMSKTHRQEQCPRCGLWKVWVPKRKKAKA